jgi:hypothetical protein
MKWLKAAWIAAVAAALLVMPAAAILASTATEAVMISPHHPSAVEVNRGLWELDRPDPSSADFEKRVIALYGNGSERVKAVFVPAERFIRPPEKPGLVLLPVDKQKGENPLQAQTVWFVAKWALLGTAWAGVMLCGAWQFLRARQRAATAKASETPSR